MHNWLQVHAYENEQVFNSTHFSDTHFPENFTKFLCLTAEYIKLYNFFRQSLFLQVRSVCLKYSLVL